MMRTRYIDIKFNSCFLPCLYCRGGGDNTRTWTGNEMININIDDYGDDDDD